MSVSIRALRADDIGAVVEFSVRAWKPVFESFSRVMGPEIYQRIYPDWRAGQARVVDSACRAEGNRAWVAESDGHPVGFVVVVIHDEAKSGEIYMLAVVGVDRIAELGIPLAEISTGGDPGHAPARHVYEKAGFTAVPLVRYYKVLPGGK